MYQTISKKINDTETDELELVEKMLKISYDPLGRRIQKMFNNGAYRNYTYAGQNIILEENYAKKDKLKDSREFIYGNTPDDILYMQLIENKTKKEQQEYVNAKGKTKTRNIKIAYTETTSYYYYEKDHLGSILAITDDSANIIVEYRYDAFGKPYSKLTDGTITSLKKSPIGNTRFYTGREYERGLALYYNRARYYNPTLGRFISRDPIGIADDVNLYSYVKNNPVGFTDVFGLAAKAFIQNYDATDLLLADMLSGKSEGTLSLVRKSSSKKGKYNVKFREDYRELSFNPDTKESCKDNYSYNCVVYIDGIQIQTLSELGNFLIGYNFNYSGYTLNNQYGTFYNDIYQAGLFTEDVGKRRNFTQNFDLFNDAVENERYDRKFYDAGFKYAKDEKRGVIGLNVSRYLDF